MDQVICFESDLCNNKNLYISLAAFILIPVCWLRSFKYLAYVSMASNVFLFFACKFPSPATCVVFVIAKYCFQNQIDKPELHNDLNLFTPSALPLFFGVAVFDFEGNGIVINLHASMSDPSKFEYVLHRVLFVYVAMICSFSALAYYVSFIKLTLI